MKSLLPLLCVCSACAAVGDDYRRPDEPLPKEWSVAPSTEAIDLDEWWLVFDDALLTDLIARAQLGNFDFAIASASVREARALLGVANSALGPTVDANAAFHRSRQSLDSRNGAPFFGRRENDLWDVGFDANWELDVFGGLRREVEAARADLASVEESRRATLVSLTAETARAYVELRGFQRRLAIVRARVDMQEQLAEIVDLRADAGVSTDLDSSRARAQVASSRAEIPTLEARIAERVHALSLLLGLAPRELAAELDGSDVIPNPSSASFLRQPLDLLRRRPDLRAAERRCAAASARTAAAFAARYPRISLGASFGWLANDTDDLFHSSAIAASIGPSISLPLFDSGLRRASFDGATERETQAVLAYQDAVLGAAKEVEDALTALAGATERRATLRAAVESQERASQLSRDLYSGGIVDFLVVLDAERELYALQDQFAQSEAECALQTVALAKALGGGWDFAQSEANARTAAK